MEKVQEHEIQQFGYMPRFRAWHVKDQQMWYDTGLLQTAFNLDAQRPLVYDMIKGSRTGEWIFMLSAEMEAHGGEKLYQGDILNIGSEQVPGLAEIVWYHGGLGLRHLHPTWIARKGEYRFLPFNLHLFKKWGNRYENPELLTFHQKDKGVNA